MVNQFASKYVFSTVSTSFVSAKKQFPKYAPSYGVIPGALAGLYLASLAFTGKPLPELLLWLVVVLYSAVGGIVGFTAYCALYGRKLLNYEFHLNGEAARFLNSFPDYWAIPIETVKTCLIEDGFTGETITAPDGVKWKIVDSFQDTNEIALMLRREP